jgi:ADP-ribose pyrophosphatase YjhB (NUDIX family)
MPGSSRNPPVWPVLAASVAVFRAGRVLLAARGKEPLRGVYTLPGGKVEPGETLAEAALREVIEETGLEPQLIGFVDHVELIQHDDAGRIQHHYVIAAFAARWHGGEPRPSEEATDFRWADPVTLDGLPVTDGLHAIVAKAAVLAG